jgi:serine/threonine-protein kinase
MSSATLTNTSIGDYRIVGKLGEGGMGEVYQGVHSKIGRVVAVKLLSRASENPQFVERFLNEARIQAGLQHNNIATLYDFLEYRGQPCIIMEYIEGQTLTDCIRSCGCLQLADALRYFQPIVEAIDYVHSRGIVHRDIKSNNIKITPTGQVKLLDFGIAKSGASPSLTITGGFVGTLQYLSPEQIKGGYADARSDIWALGVLLYEMTTSRLPFDATTLGELYEQISKVNYVAPSLMNRNIPREVQNIIARCLKKNAADRYRSANDLLQDVVKARENVPAGAANTQHPGRTIDSQTKSKTMIFVSVAAIFALVVIGAAYFLLSGPDSNANKSGQQSIAPASSGSRQPAQQQMFTVDVAEGRADVYRNGERVGTTPYQFQAKSGEQLDLLLKRDGYQDKPVRLSTSENKRTYTFMLEKK